MCTFRTEEQALAASKEVKGCTHTYYQVLIDARDIPHIVSSFTRFLLICPVRDHLQIAYSKKGGE